MTFVWMNYGRMVGDSTLQTVNTTGLILQGIYVFSFYSITSHKLQAGKKIFLTILLLFIIGMYIITAEDLEGDNPEHWLAGSNHVICLLLCPTCQYSRGDSLLFYSGESEMFDLSQREYSWQHQWPKC